MLLKKGDISFFALLRTVGHKYHNNNIKLFKNKIFQFRQKIFFSNYALTHATIHGLQPIIFFLLRKKSTSQKMSNMKLSLFFSKLFNFSDKISFVFLGCLYYLTSASVLCRCLISISELLTYSRRAV